jgi:hypothetical protein
MAAKAKPFSRKGLHRLECPACSCYGYFTVAMLESAGELPECFARGCGETMMPAELELARILGLDEAPVVQAWVDLARRKEMGQKPAQIRASRGKPGELANMWDRAAAELESARREQARNRRGRRWQAPAATVEAMPF